MAGDRRPGSDAARQELIREIIASSERNRALTYQLLPPAEPPQDLTLQQIRVLRLAAATPGLSVHAMARVLGVAGPTASGLVERLVRKGLLQRVDDPTDRRVRRVHLTEAAEHILQGLDSAFIPMLEMVTAELSAEELEQLLNTIRIVADAMARASSADGRTRSAVATSRTP